MTDTVTGDVRYPTPTTCAVCTTGRARGSIPGRDIWYAEVEVPVGTPRTFTLRTYASSPGSGDPVHATRLSEHTMHVAVARLIEGKVSPRDDLTVHEVLDLAAEDTYRHHVVGGVS